MVRKVIWLAGIIAVSVLVVGYHDAGHPDKMVALAPQRTPTLTPTATRTPLPPPSRTPTASFTPSTTPAATATDGSTETVTSFPTATLSATPAELPTPTATTINQLLRALQADNDFVIRFRLDGTCFEVNHEITGTIAVRNLKPAPIYVYLAGQIMFSINNSPLRPDFPPREPVLREDFYYLQPNEEITLLEIEDLGLYIQGIGPESGIDFIETETVYGLPVGEYWVTAGYSNPHDGLKQQRDKSYLIPQAAWRGVAISREIRFYVVEDLDDCPVNT